MAVGTLANKKVPALVTKPRLYTLQNIRKMTDIWTPENVTAAYQKYAAQANKRLLVMAKYDIGRESQTYKMNSGRFLPANKLTLGEQKVLLADAARMLLSETGSYTGIVRKRRRDIQTLHEHGYEFVTNKNFDDFIAFMEEWRAQELDHMVGSPTAAELFNLWHNTGKKSLEELISSFSEYVDQKRQEAGALESRQFGRQVRSQQFREEFAAWAKID